MFPQYSYGKSLTVDNIVLLISLKECPQCVYYLEKTSSHCQYSKWSKVKLIQPIIFLPALHWNGDSMYHRPLLGHKFALELWYDTRVHTKVKLITPLKLYMFHCLTLLKGFVPLPIQSNLGCLEMSQCVVGWFCGVLSWLMEGMISNVGQNHPTSICVCDLRQCLWSKTIKWMLLSICINVLLIRWRQCRIDFPLIHVHSDHRPKPTRLTCRITVQIILVDVCAHAHVYAHAYANLVLG